MAKIAKKKTVKKKLSKTTETTGKELSIAKIVITLLPFSKTRVSGTQAVSFTIFFMSDSSITSIWTTKIFLRPFNHRNCVDMDWSFWAEFEFGRIF